MTPALDALMVVIKGKVQVTDSAVAHTPFATFADEAGSKIRHALVAAFGPQVGTEAAADAMSIAWEKWDQISCRPNPAGYVWGIGRNTALKLVSRRTQLFPTPPPDREPWIEPGLPAAIEHLSDRQRMAVLLTSGYGWTFKEVAELMGVGISTVQAHVERGMAKLRMELGVNDDES